MYIILHMCMSCNELYGCIVVVSSHGSKIQFIFASEMNVIIQKYIMLCLFVSEQTLIVCLNDIAR